MKLVFVKLAAAAALFVFFSGASAPAFAIENCKNTGSFSAWLQDFKKEAIANGISKSVVRSVSPHLKFQQRIINIDRGQRVFSLDFLSFSKRVIPKYRLQRGGQLIKKMRGTFSRVEKKYGVPAPVLVALWGLESDFGAFMGKDRTLPALTTLAYDCRRPELFRKQLFAALEIIQRGDLRADDMIGAWAGELGQTQFLPMHYVDHGVDFDGDGKVNLIRSKSDVLASTANYLKHIGWQRGEPWLEEVRLPSNFKWEETDISIEHPRSQWASWGVKRANGKSVVADDKLASIVLPVGRFGPAFMVYPNFRVFLEWNNSLVYSTSAAFFASRLNGAGPYKLRGNVEVFDGKKIKLLQRRLAKRGYDVGKIDGIIGQKTRIAVKDVQLKLGLPADAYPTDRLLSKLQ